MKLRTILAGMAAAIIAACLAAGCGSKTATNTVTVTVGSSLGSIILIGQSTTLTATVTGGTTTNTAVNWQPCQFTTTTISGTTPTTSTPAACPTDGSLGALSNQQTTGTATYTAPSKIPDQTKFPGLQIIITAQSQQDTSKTGNIKLILDSGIGVNLTPVTATVATNEPQGFRVALSNDLQSQGVTWLLTQSTATTTITEPNLATCSPGCGSITSSTATTMTYTAPATVPTASIPAGASTTPTNVTIVATAKADNTRFATGTITIIQGGPITFNGISPIVAPQGAALWDIYLDAPNMSSASKITITDQNGGSKVFDSTSGQVKVIFPIPTSTTPNPSPSGARLRLLEGDLAGATSASSGTLLTYTVSVTDPGQPVTQGAGPFTFELKPVRPTIVASAPNGVVQGGDTAEFPVAIDGGYFGPGGTFAPASFQGNTLSQTSSNSRRLVATFQGSKISNDPPGLYPLTVSRSTPPLPSPNNAAVSTIAVFPNYFSGPPATPAAASVIPAGTYPSAIDIDPTLGIIAVVETGSNAVQFFQIGAAGGTLTSLGSFPVGQTPTGVSVNRTNHSVAVVNYGGQSVSILPIPTSSSTVTPATIDLSKVLQGQVLPAPLPYAIGVDPDTNLALVAYSSTSTSSFANLGFIVNLNQGANPPFGCLANSPPQGPCIFSQVTLNTGQYPQIAMAQHGHMAYVTPGGSGVVKGVDVTAPSASVALSTLSVTAGIVTATASATLTGLVPGIPATVLISGVPALPGNINLNGVFPIGITSSTSFQYSLPSNESSASGTANGGTVFYGSPNLNFGGISPTSQGIAINPITRTAAIANAGTASQQLNILNQLDQSVTSISFQLNCTAFTVTCNGGIETPLSTVAVAWQPYTNSIVSYNPDLRQVSISEPITQKRYAIVPVNGLSATAVPVPNIAGLTLRLWGGIAVDPVTNQAIVVESGNGSANPGQIELINLAAAGTSPANALQSAQITEVVVPSPTPGPGIIGGIPNAVVPQATLTSTADLAGVQIFGSGFTSGVSQVRLDGTFIPLGNVAVDASGRKITATIPASFLSLPHRFALDVVNGAAPSTSNTSNAVDFIVVKAVDVSVACSTGPATPSSVAIADQLKTKPFWPIAVITNSGCNNISMIDINPLSPKFGTLTNPFSTTLPGTLSVGAGPQGIAINQHLGLAVVANNGAGTASVVDLVNMKEAVPDVTTGTSPIGVAINEVTGVALVANFGSNTVSQINLGLLSGSSPATSLTATSIGGVQLPIAIAIDPDRGTNNQGLAEVTGLQTTSSGQVGALYPVDIGLASPTLSTTVSIGSVNSTPSGIVFDPAVATGTANPGLFFVNSSGSNVISSFNPDNGLPSPTNVGINPTALAVNPQTGAILTTNFTGKSASIVDTLSSPIKTVQTYGLPGSVQFGVAIDPFTNLAVIVDQAHNRVLLFPMPN
jgi:DNA-binding beta-propeller fold protein YncE